MMCNIFIYSTTLKTLIIAYSKKNGNIYNFSNVFFFFFEVTFLMMEGSNIPSHKIDVLLYTQKKKKKKRTSCPFQLCNLDTKIQIWR